MAIYTNILTGGSNSHETTSENANQISTDFVSEGVVGAITNTAGVAPATGAFAVNAQGTPDMTVAVSSGVAYVTATPSGQASQALRVYNNASANVTISANSSGSTKYDWIYISISAANAADPNTAGDNVATLVASRSSSSASDDGTPPTYGYPIAVVTVANGASSITNGNIADIRDITGATPSDASVTSRKLAPTVIIETCTGNVTTSSTTVADITGCSSTFTPAVASVAKVTGVFDSDPDTANDLFSFFLDVDGVDADGAGVHQSATSGNNRQSITMIWLVSLTAAAHTLKLQVQRSSGSGTNTVRATNTRMVIELVGSDNATVS